MLTTVRTSGDVRQPYIVMTPKRFEYAAAADNIVREGKIDASERACGWPWLCVARRHLPCP